MKAIGSKLIVEKLEATEEKRGSIYVPTTATDGICKGRVQSVYPEYMDQGKLRTTPIDAGDVVAFKLQSTLQLPEGGPNCYLLDISNILYVVE